jgi:hypothetical protein
MELLYLFLVVVSLVNLGCWIIVLAKLFSEEGAAAGCLGIICGLYTFIWGWQNSDRLGVRNVMVIWTACFLIGIASNFCVQL